jgi:hypothetical protein
MIPVRSGKPEPMASQLRPRAEEDEMIDRVRLVAGNRSAEKLEASNGFPVSCASDRCNQVTTVSIGAFNCCKSSSGADG